MNHDLRAKLCKNVVPYFSLFFTQELAISFGHQTYTASHVNHDTSQLGISPSESWKFSRIPCWLWQCLYKIVIYYSHPQIDGKVNHHWFSRVLITKTSFWGNYNVSFNDFNVCLISWQTGHLKYLKLGLKYLEWNIVLNFQYIF